MAKTQSIPSDAAVSVKPHGIGACEAAHKISGKRFLCSEAPFLPLETCDRHGQCKCKYEKWDDRRQEERRSIVDGMANQYYSGDEKRGHRRGRRVAD